MIELIPHKDTLPAQEQKSAQPISGQDNTVLEMGGVLVMANLTGCPHPF